MTLRHRVAAIAASAVVVLGGATLVQTPSGETVQTQTAQESSAHFEGAAKYEGLRTKAYRDIVGVWTIGYGHTGGVKAGDTITPLQAQKYLKSDIDRIGAGVKKCLGANTLVSQNEIDAFFDLAVNIGDGAFCRSSIPAKVRAGDYVGACKTILEFGKVRDTSQPKIWNNRKKRWEYPLVPNNGLMKRRQAEYRLCMTPVASNEQAQK